MNIAEASNRADGGEGLAIGQVVRLTKPCNEREAEARYELVEDNGSRVVIRYVTGQMVIRPTEVVRREDVCPA